MADVKGYIGIEDLGGALPDDDSPPPKLQDESEKRPTYYLVARDLKDKNGSVIERGGGYYHIGETPHTIEEAIYNLTLLQGKYMACRIIDVYRVEADDNRPTTHPKNYIGPVMYNKEGKIKTSKFLDYLRKQCQENERSEDERSEPLESADPFAKPNNSSILSEPEI